MDSGQSSLARCFGRLIYCVVMHIMASGLCPPQMRVPCVPEKRVGVFLLLNIGGLSLAGYTHPVGMNIV